MLLNVSGMLDLGGPGIDFCKWWGKFGKPVGNRGKPMGNPRVVFLIDNYDDLPSLGHRFPTQNQVFASGEPPKDASAARGAAVLRRPGSTSVRGCIENPTQKF